ncbi:MAG: ATP phosphoribosyltransferase [Planctomycetes bacterium]|nr:ATP phosphoribosyltransferase [Planctomycetota bacterium]
MLTIALTKGRLLAGALARLAAAGIRVPGVEESRELAVRDLSGKHRLIFLKDMDCPTYVEYGVADVGICGKDVIGETGCDVLEPLDLGFGRCRMVVAGPAARARNSGEVPTSLRVATKYPRTALAHFEAGGIPVELIRLSGSVELAPGLGLSDLIVDLVETGRTLKANRLAVREVIAESTARCIVNRASYAVKNAAVRRFLDAVGSP